MRIQIVSDDGKVIFVPSLNQHLERDIKEHFAVETKWWERKKRKRYAHFCQEIDRVCDDLRNKTRFI